MTLINDHCPYRIAVWESETPAEPRETWTLCPAQVWLGRSLALPLFGQTPGPPVEREAGFGMR